MHEAQAKGYYLEEIVRELMRDSHFINVQTGNIEGRGADHQIDSARAQEQVQVQDFQT